MRPAPEHPLLGAHVSGFAAFVLCKMLADQLPGRLVSLTRMAEAGRLDPARVSELTSTWAHIRVAAEAWATWRAAVDESAEDPVAEVDPQSSQEIDTATAATLLQVTESRVRQLARGGVINARRVGRTWLVSRSDCEIRRDAA